MRKAALALLAGVLACAVFAGAGGCGQDVWHVFRPAAVAYLQNRTRLYDGGAPGFFFAPWCIYPLLLTAWLPARWAWAVVMTVNLGGISLACYAVSDEHTPRLARLLVLASMPTVALAVGGNIDGIMAGAVGLAWLAIRRRRAWLLGPALLVLSCKPINVALVALLYLRLAWAWTGKERLAVVAPTVAALALSFPLFGLDWPARYVRALRDIPPLVAPQVSLWRALAWIGCPLWPAYVLAGVAALVAVVVILKTKRPDAGTLARLLALSLAFSPYVLDAHLVLVAPALVWLASKDRRWCWLWLATLAPIARLWLGNELAWLSLAYPLALLVAVCWQCWRDSTQVLLTPSQDVLYLRKVTFP